MEGTPTLVMLSGADEYVPPRLLEAAHDIASRLAGAMGPSAKGMVVPNAKHAMDGAEEAGIAAMAEFVQGLAPNRTQ